MIINLLSSLIFVSGPGNFCLIHVSLVPVLNVVGEQVTNKRLFAEHLFFGKVNARVKLCLLCSENKTNPA